MSRKIGPPAVPRSMTYEGTEMDIVAEHLEAKEMQGMWTFGDPRWHLSDAHGPVIMFGSTRWLEPTKGEKVNQWTHAELLALVHHLNVTGFRP